MTEIIYLKILRDHHTGGDMMRYQVMVRYDDGFETAKDFDNETSAKNYFHNVDVQDTEYVILNSRDGDVCTEVARKEPRKKKTADAV
jgi:hypothetical protein